MIKARQNLPRFTRSTSSGPHQAPKSGANELIVAVGTGDWGDANVVAYVEPFRNETGIDVTVINEWFDPKAVRQLGQQERSHVDVVPVAHTTVVEAGQAGLLHRVDYNQHDPTNLASMPENAKRAYGVAPFYYSINIAFWRDKFPQGGPRAWVDFWNVEKFPGKRALRTGDYPAGLIESALLADGVAAAELYPLDIDRAFAKLGTIKPNIVNWWRDGVDQQQVFADRVADLGSAFNGRISNLQNLGLTIDLEWNEGFLVLDYFVMPKGGPNATNAQRFMSFLTRAENQAAFATRIPYGPTNPFAYRYISPKLASMLPSHPNNLKRQIIIDTDWYMEISGGQTNEQRIIERWNALFCGA